MYGIKPLKKASKGINYSKAVNSLIATFIKAFHKNETHNGLLVFDWAYRCVIGDGKLIPWTYFASESNLVRTLTDLYIYALRDRGYICKGTWPEIRKAKKREWQFDHFLDSIHSQVIKEVNTINYVFATQLAKSQAEVLLYKHQHKYDMTMAAIKIQQEREEKTKIQQEAVVKQVSQAKVHQVERIKTKQEMKLLLEQLNNSKTWLIQTLP
jgi:hypothetical protein